MNGEGLAAILDLVDRGIVRILDLRAVKREADGTFTEIEIADFDSDGTLDLAVFEGVSSGLLDDDDLSQAASLIEPGKVVALLVWENTWAAPFVSAMRRVVRTSLPVAGFRPAMLSTCLTRSRSRQPKRPHPPKRPRHRRRPSERGNRGG